MVRRSSLVVRRALALGTLPGLLLAMLLGAAMLALVYQIPARHDVDIGGYDAAYIQGFWDAEGVSANTSQPYLVGSDGSVRWSRDRSYLLFPQAGLPGTITLRLRGWRASGPPPHIAVLLNGREPLAAFDTSGDWEQHTFPITSGLLKPNDVFVEIRADITRLDDGRNVGVLLDSASYRVGPGFVTPYPAQLVYGALAAGMLWLLYRGGEEQGAKSEERGLGQRPSSPASSDERRKTKDEGLVVWLSSFVFRLSSIWLLGSWFLILGSFVFLYRLQPLYPYPLRGLLPGIDLVLAAALVVQAWRRAQVRDWIAARPALLDLAAVVSIAVWTIMILLVSGDHLTLARPGVENDFRVFATRDTLARVFQADGFYNLGYPLLLWLTRFSTEGNAFLAARLLSALSGALLLGASYWLVRWSVVGGRWSVVSRQEGRRQAEDTRHETRDTRHETRQEAEDSKQTRLVASSPLASRIPHPALLSGRCMGLLALLILMFSPFVVEYGLYVGSDMPFAALVTLTIALMIRGTRNESETKDERRKTKARQSLPSRISRLVSPVFRLPLPASTFLLLAGIAAGCAFLVRHLGLVLLPWGLLHCWMSRPRTEKLVIPRTESQASNDLPSSVFSLHPSSFILFLIGFLIAASPQLAVNTWQTGNPLYNQQAKNVWLAVYGSGDWGRWDEAPNDIRLSEVVLRDPGRFLMNWSNNLRAFVGTGAEDTSEFGRAIQLRLLAWPANWLALCYIGFWIVSFGSSWFNSKRKTQNAKLAISLLILIAFYTLAVCMAFALPRFFLPLAPIYALAAAWMCQTLVEQWGRRRQSIMTNLAPVGCIVLLLLLWPSFGIGTRYVLDGQPADEVAITRLVLDTLQPGDGVLVCVPFDVPLGKYSAIAHRTTLCPTDGNDAAATRAADLASVEQARRSGSVAYLLWSEVPREARATVPLPDSALVGQSGVYRLYRLKN